MQENRSFDQLYGTRPGVRGFGFFGGHVKRFRTPGLKVPQIGWNQLEFADRALVGDPNDWRALWLGWLSEGGVPNAEAGKLWVRPNAILTSFAVALHRDAAARWGDRVSVRLTFNGREYDINGVKLIGRNEYIEITATARAETP